MKELIPRAPKQKHIIRLIQAYLEELNVPYDTHKHAVNIWRIVRKNS